MSVYLIGYDLNAPGKNYNQLIDAITKSYPDYWHCLDSTWLVNTAYNAVQIRDHLMQFLDQNDRLLVAVMGSNEAAWVGFDQNCSDWLQARL